MRKGEVREGGMRESEVRESGVREGGVRGLDKRLGGESGVRGWGEERDERMG